MNDLFKSHKEADEPVQCLGITFQTDEARREHFLRILGEKLKEPSFRQIEGFPIGADEDILALSDPPYYTACPNPFIEEFIKQYGKPYDPSVPYSKEPFAADVSEGKNDPIYNAHSYHTKVPHKAIMRYILHYTQPGELILDGFCGTGMTGVAAQLCGDRKVVESLGYRVESDGTILEQRHDQGDSSWEAVSKLGPRRSILNDLSTAATFIAFNYNTPIDFQAFEQEANKILHDAAIEFGWMYETYHTDATTRGRINFTVWSDVFTCNQCAGEVVFWEAGVDKTAGKAREEFSCPHCSASLTKRSMERAYASHFDPFLKQVIKHAKQVPVLINYSVGKKRFEKTPDDFDLQLIEKIDAMATSDWVPTDRMMDGGETRRNDPIGITHVHHFYTWRNLKVLGFLRERISQVDRRYLFWFTSALTWVGKENRLHLGNYFGGGGGVITSLRGTWYVASLSVETSVLERFSLRTRAQQVRNGTIADNSITTCGSFSNLAVPTASVDYLFIDPPFGGNLMYAELNFLWEAWLRVITNNKLEAVENKNQGKTLDEYRRLMTVSFKEAFRVLKPGRWMTVEFSNTQAAVWNAIQLSLQEAGFVVANVSALDKGKGSFKAVNTTTAVKQDLIISAYKPNGGLEERFAKAGGSEDSAWDFVRTHLKYLPTVKVKDGQIEFVAERDPRIIFDRLVAWFVRHNFQVPLSSLEFQAGLSQRFADRDGMVFLPEQVSEYDKKRLQTAQAPQMELFIADERSAIDWLTDYLKRKPSTYQEIHPDFISQLGAGWKKHEARPELSDLLASNFFCYDPKSKDSNEVPSQIHSYLSSNFKDLRGLDKDDKRLKAKATDRWYVPDPSKAQELERLREKSLLKEFDGYKAHAGRKLKEFRLEAMRSGFKFCWGSRDYATIIAVAKKIPEDVLQEDEKLLLWYDQALTRMEGDS